MSSKRIEQLSTTDASGGATYSEEHSFPVGNEFPVSIAVDVTGTVNYTVQYDIGGVWYSHPVLASLTADSASNIASPVMRVRLVQNSGNGSCVMTVVESYN